MNSNKRKIRWGILGTSNIARTHIVSAMQNSINSEVIAIGSRSDTRAREFGREFGVQTVFSNYDDLINSPLVDAVYISVPTGMHYEWSLKAANANKPTLCEKPITTTSSELVQLIKEFKRSNILLAEASMYKFHPLTSRVKELVKEKRIGEIKHINSHFNTSIENKNDVRLQPKLGGGALLDLGYYCIGIMQHLINEAPIVASASSQWVIKNDVDLWTTGVLHYPSGITGAFSCGFLSPFEISYEIIGTQGSINIPHGGMVLWPGSDFKIRIRDCSGVTE